MGEHRLPRPARGDVVVTPPAQTEPLVARTRTPKGRWRERIPAAPRTGLRWAPHWSTAAPPSRRGRPVPTRCSSSWPATLSLRARTGRWRGVLPGGGAGSRYRFLVLGPGGSGLKRDPWARELDAGYPDCD